ncbi:MAG: hypothetical protein JWN70_4504 [Planctomycetaceae bacterium]|nr:hypothetical protein [Planctomycetaceae bacterium]
MYCIRRVAKLQTGERLCENLAANYQSATLNRGQQILLPLFSASGSLGHETIDPICHGKPEFCDTHRVSTTSRSAARRSTTRNRPRHLAKLVLIPTVSLTVFALRQGTEYTDVRTR